MLHHMRLLIAGDAFLHGAIICLSLLAVYQTVLMARLVRNHPNTNRAARASSWFMLAIMGFVVYSAFASFYSCACQYSAWWNR